jgi:sec-independent protein translocase protein TatB
MLDIGFSELLVIGGVALVVLGPEKLAVVARTAGKWTGKAQRYVNDVKADIAREGELAELRKLKEEMESAGRDVGASLRTTAQAVQQDMHTLEHTVTHDINTAATLNAEQAEATIQASLDSAAQVTAYTPPAIDMTGRYQNSLDATISPPPLYDHDPIAQRMALDLLQDDLSRLENRMDELKRNLAQATQNAGGTKVAA